MPVLLQFIPFLFIIALGLVIFAVYRRTRAQREALESYDKAGRALTLLGWFSLTMAIVVLLPLIFPVLQDRGFHGSSFRNLIFLLVVGGILHLVVGKAVKDRKDWGRTAGLILGVLSLFAFPIGTAIGAYILWCLTKGLEAQDAGKETADTQSERLDEVLARVQERQSEGNS